MDPVASNQIRSQSLIGAKPASVGSTAAPRQQAPKVEVQASPRPVAPASTSVGGVETTRSADGTISQKAVSGLGVTTDADGGKEVSLGSGESFRWDDTGVSSNDPSLKPTLTRTEDGLNLISFVDKDENTVQVQPDSLTYEVLNKKKNLSQVFHPDGFQEVVAFGQFREADGSRTDYQHHLVYNPQGELVDSSGFHDMALDGRKMSFDLGNGVRTERTLARPLPGQPSFGPEVKSEPQAAAASAPMTMMEEPVALPKSEAPTAPAPAETASAAQPTPFSGLTDIKNDFFAGHDQEGVAFDQTPSGLVMRHEGETRAFLLPNGDSFRTNGKDVETLGESPRAKNVRIVDEGDNQLLAYSDLDGNRHTLDISSGDYEVSNRQGSVTQGLKADGTTEYGVRGTYTSESGKPQQYHHKASFSQNGALLSKEGFDDLKVEGTSMKFTLPNGVETDRELIESAPDPINIPKKLVLKEGFAQEWGGGVSLADQLLGLGGAPTGIGAAAPSAPTNPTSPVEAPQAAPAGPTWRPGQARQSLPDGSGTVSVLPNGYQIISGPEPYAIDTQGQRLPVGRGQTTLESGETSHLLSVRTPEGVSYTICSQNLDTIVTSADGKVSQMVSPQGKVLTSVTDNGRKVLYEFDPGKGTTGTPGVGFDPRFPDRLMVAGTPEGYKLPHPMMPPNGMPGNSPLSAPGGQVGADAAMSEQNPELSSGYLAGPGGVGQGVQPSFWQRFKSAFTNENPWDPATAAAREQDQQRMFGGPMGSAPYPAGYQQVPYSMDEQLRAMQRQNNWMMAGTVAMTALPALSMMFFNPYGMF